MNKQIIFSLLFIATAPIHGMEKIVSNEDCTEKTLQTDITTYARANNLSDHHAAKLLMKTNDCYKPIYEKINHLFDIAYYLNLQFTEEDLCDPWYVNTTKFCASENSTRQSTLLSMTYEATQFRHPYQLDKIKTLIHAKIDVKNSINNYLLNKIYWDRGWKKKKFELPTRLLTIAELLLEHGADPNFKPLDEKNTPFITTICGSIDPKYAHLLLWYNADPYKITVNNLFGNYGYSFKRTCNAFDLENTGWLKKIVADKQQTIFKYLLFEHHILDTQKLLPEIVNLIRYKIWEVGKNSFKTVQSQIDQSQK